MASRASQLMSFGIGAIVLAAATSSAGAQAACKAGTEVSGETKIEKMGSIKGGVGMTVSQFTDCKLKFVVLSLNLIMESVATSAGCTVGKTVKVSGVIARHDGRPSLQAKTYGCE
jgi:primosomal replication protein N